MKLSIFKGSHKRMVASSSRNALTALTIIALSCCSCTNPHSRLYSMLHLTKPYLEVCASGVASADDAAQNTASPQPTPASPLDSGANANGAALNVNIANLPIGANDLLDVVVSGQADLSHQYTVDSNGDIAVPYIKKAHVEGLSLDQAGALLQGKLAEFYVNPQVTVTRVSIGGISVNVTGAVQRQGAVVARRDAHVNDIIQLAGPSSDADLSKIQLTRGLPGETHTLLTVDLAAFLDTGRTSGNPAVIDSDTIFVPHKAQTTISVSIVGDVSRPGRYDVQPGSTAFDLVTTAGGLSPDADRPNLYIQPLGTLSRVAFDYNKASGTPQDSTLNPILKDGDKIVVPEESADSNIFTVTGGVLKAGQYPWHGQISLLDAIGQAGGFQPRAKTKQTTVTRETPKGASVIKIDSGNPAVAGAFTVEPGDNIYIPEGSPAAPPPNPLEIVGILGTILTIFGRGL